VNSRAIFLVASAAALALVVLVYWPATKAGFVWVDRICFDNAAWLRYGDAWKHLIFHDFYDWVNYFRPLVLALFVAQVRWLDADAGGMHVVSLAIHLVNIALVGLLALRFMAAAHLHTAHRRLLAVVSMLLYGLHPALIEPVAWISCQFDLLVTTCMLAGLLCNLTISGRWFRAVSVSGCFLLAACAKESAVAFPIVLVLVDWMQQDPEKDGTRATLRALWRRQGAVYVGIFASGLAYLALRYWALGFLVQSQGSGAFGVARLHIAAFIFLTYLRIVAWPMFGLGPMHIVDTRTFDSFSPTLAVMDATALIIPLAGLYLARQRKPIGVLILVITAALLPVLHVIPVDFDASLYHERYATAAVAFACAMLPRVFVGLTVPASAARIWRSATAILLTIWLAVAIANIRVTLPLWADETKLWLWSVERYPDYAPAQSHLLAAFVGSGDVKNAREMADVLLQNHPECVDCMLNIAALAVNDGDAVRLKGALERAARAMQPPFNPRLLQAYVIASGQLDEMQGQAQDAMDAYQEAIRIEPLDPLARMDLALLLARQGQVEAARATMDAALELFAPDQRERRRQEFEKIAMTGSDAR